MSNLVITNEVRQAKIVGNKIILSVSNNEQKLQINYGIANITVAGGGLFVGTTGEDISALRCLRTNSSGNILKMDLDVTYANSCVGISTTAATTGNSINVVHGSEITDNSWNWNMNQAIYCGADGVLTQTPPAGPFMLEVACVIAPNKILVSIQKPIITN